MRREDIPAGLRIARAKDVARIPAAALAKMQPADVALRLLAADEYRRRAEVPHLDGDLFRARISQASTVLTTANPAEASALIKAAGVTATPQQSAAGVPGWVHRPFTGTHDHDHSAWGAANADRGGGHTHRHEHRGDSNHHHAHTAASAKSTLQSRTAASTAALATALRKQASTETVRSGFMILRGLR